jgi:hypothetical protein
MSWQIHQLTINDINSLNVSELGKKVLYRNIKCVIYVVTALILWTNPVRASCYGWEANDISTIHLEDKRNSYYRIWKDKKRSKLAAKLRHGDKIKVIKFIEGDCGGDVYLEAVVKGRTIRGWTDSDELVYHTRKVALSNLR